MQSCTRNNSYISIRNSIAYTLLIQSKAEISQKRKIEVTVGGMLISHAEKYKIT